MNDLWRWQCKNCAACFTDEGAIGGATCPYCGNVGRRVMLIPDFHDDRPDDKAEKGSWSDWKNKQDRDYVPGRR